MTASEVMAAPSRNIPPRIRSESFVRKLIPSSKVVIEQRISAGDSEMTGAVISPIGRRLRYLMRMDDGPRIIRAAMPLAEVRELADRSFGDMVKASVDIGRGVLAIGGELHSDEEALLIDDGAVQADVWGINIYPDEPGDAWIEFDSMINVRPGQGNRSRGVDDPAIQSRIRQVVERLIHR